MSQNWEGEKTIYKKEFFKTIILKLLQVLRKIRVHYVVHYLWQFFIIINLCWESQCFFSNKFYYFFKKKNIWIFFHNINVTNFSNIEGENAKLSIAQNWGQKKTVGLMI
jgi:uncharacterized protein YhbP (UPF0306 family)